MNSLLRWKNFRAAREPSAPKILREGVRDVDAIMAKGTEEDKKTAPATEEQEPVKLEPGMLIVLNAR